MPHHNEDECQDLQSLGMGVLDGIQCVPVENQGSRMRFNQVKLVLRQDPYHCLELQLNNGAVSFIISGELQATLAKAVWLSQHCRPGTCT